MAKVDCVVATPDRDPFQLVNCGSWGKMEDNILFPVEPSKYGDGLVPVVVVLPLKWVGHHYLS